MIYSFLTFFDGQLRIYVTEEIKPKFEPLAVIERPSCEFFNGCCLNPCVRKVC